MLTSDLLQPGIQTSVAAVKTQYIMFWTISANGANCIATDSAKWRGMPVKAMVRKAAPAMMTHMMTLAMVAQVAANEPQTRSDHSHARPLAG